MKTMETRTPERPPPPRRLASGLDPRRRGAGSWAFVLSRITGLGLVVYLYVHLGVLSLLARGPESWDSFIDVVRSKPFLALDVVVIAGWLVHALNGIRVTLANFSFGARVQKAMFSVAMVVAAVLLVIMSVLIFEGS